MHSCYVASELAAYASTSSKPLPVDPATNEVAVSAFPYRLPAVQGDHFEAKFPVSLLPPRDECSDSVKFALYAKVQCNCSRAICGAGAVPQSAFAYTTAPLTKELRHAPTQLTFCCGSSNPASVEQQALPDNSDSEIAVDDVMRTALLRALPMLPSKPTWPAKDAPKILPAAEPVELQSEQQVHELHARQLDDEGTTGEVQIPGSTSLPSSGSGTCPLPAVGLRVVSGTSVELSVDASVCITRKRGVNDFSIEQSQDGGSSFATIYETPDSQFTHVVDGLTEGQQYSFRVCFNGGCGPWASVTPSSSGGAPVTAPTGASTIGALGMEPWLIGVIVAAAVVAIGLIVLIVVLARRRRTQKKEKTPPVVSSEQPITPEAVLPQISISSDAEEEEDDSAYLDRFAGGLKEESRARALNDLLSEYATHRKVLKRKGQSGESGSGFSTSWDSDDEEEWFRLNSAATRIQAVWRGYAVRHPRTGPVAARTLTLSSAMSGFDILVEQLRAASFGSPEQAQANAALLDLLERMQRATRQLYGADADDSLLPEDIAAAVNALSAAVHAMLNIKEGDAAAFEAAAANLLQTKAALEALLTAAHGELGQTEVEVPRRTRSWSAFKALLREYRGKKASLEAQGADQAQLDDLLTQFRQHADVMLPSDDQDTEESSATAEDSGAGAYSMDSLSSRNSSGDWQKMKQMLEHFRANRPRKEETPAARVARERIQRGDDRWAERAAILQRLEMHLTKAKTDKDADSVAVLSDVSRVPKPAIRTAEITPAQPLVLDGAALPWVARETGSRNVKFAEPEEPEESEDSSEATASSEMSSEMSGESTTSNASSVSGRSSASSSSGYGIGSPIIRLGRAPVFNKRVLVKKDGSSSSERSSDGSAPRRGLSHLSTGTSRSSGSSRSAESSAEVSYSDDAPSISVDSLHKDASPRNSPRVLRRRVRSSGDGAKAAATAPLDHVSPAVDLGQAQ